MKFLQSSVKDHKKKSMSLPAHWLGLLASHKHYILITDVKHGDVCLRTSQRRHEEELESR